MIDVGVNISFYLKGVEIFTDFTLRLLLNDIQSRICLLLTIF